MTVRRAGRSVSRPRFFFAGAATGFFFFFFFFFPPGASADSPRPRLPNRECPAPQVSRSHQADKLAPACPTPAPCRRSAESHRSCAPTDCHPSLDTGHDVQWLNGGRVRRRGKRVGVELLQPIRRLASASRRRGQRLFVAASRRSDGQRGAFALFAHLASCPGQSRPEELSCRPTPCRHGRIAGDNSQLPFLNSASCLLRNRPTRKSAPPPSESWDSLRSGSACRNGFKPRLQAPAHHREMLVPSGLSQPAGRLD